jgi:ATP-dependent Clp protease ATP-binding subunit ClpX
MDNVELQIDDQVLDYIVAKADEYKLGARGLRSICESIMMDAMYEIPTSNKKKFTVTVEYAKKMLEGSNFLQLTQVC